MDAGDSRPDKQQGPPPGLQEAIELLAQAGWIESSYLDGHNIRVTYTESGREKAEQLLRLVKDIDGFRADPGVWLTLEFLLGFTLGDR